MSDTLSEPPAHDEIEVSTFGPGVGECIVVHLGDGRWMVVDSFLEDREPVALKYLRTIGISPSAITDVVVTHWHDDHIGGAAKVLEAATSARFVCSGALNREEFKTLLKAYARVPAEGRLSEMVAMLRLNGARSGGRRSHAPTWAMDGIYLMNEQNTQVCVLSPSHGTFSLAQQELGRLLPEEGPKLRPVAHTPNCIAVVLWVRVGNFCALLGSDLENTRDPGTGWGGVIGSTLRPTGLASMFKIPHHGSEGADEPAVWSKMLVPGCISVVTTFGALKDPLPRPSDLKRLGERTPHLYATGAAPAGRVRREADVE